MIDLRAIKARLEATTPGEWTIHQPRINTAIVAVDENDYITAYVAERVRESPNADFIVNARSDIVALMAKLEAACAVAECWQLQPRYYDDCGPGQNDPYYAWYTEMNSLVEALYVPMKD